MKVTLNLWPVWLSYFRNRKLGRSLEALEIKRRPNQKSFYSTFLVAFWHFRLTVNSIVEWLECHDYDQHGLDSKPTCAIMLCQIFHGSKPTRAIF